jgi:hypothetical protein
MTYQWMLSRWLMVLVTLAVGFASSACSRPKETELRFETLIKQENLYFYSSEGEGSRCNQEEMDLLVATRPDDVQQIVARLCPERPRVRWDQLMEVDYTQYWVVVAYMGAEPWSGFEITIEEMTQVGRTVRVAVSTVEPSLGTQVFVNPYHVVLVKRSALRRKGHLTFEMWEGEELLLTRQALSWPPASRGM